MKKLFIRFKIFLIAIILICFLNGCSFYANFYVLNTTNENILVELKFENNITEPIKYKRSLLLLYKDSVLKVNDQTESKLNKRLDYKQIDSFTISTIIPARSTVLVGGAMNRPSLLDSVTITRNSRTVKYSVKEIYIKTKKTGGLFPPFYTTYKFE